MIQSLKDLEKLLKLCRKQGVTEINLGEVSFKLGDMPKEVSGSVEIEDAEEAILDAFEAPLTQAEATFFANGGNPGENPYRTTGGN